MTPEEIEAITPIDESQDSNEDSDITLDLLENEGTGEPNEQELGMVAQAATETVESLDSLGSSAFENVADAWVAATDALKESGISPLPESSQEAIMILRDDAIDAAREARKKPAEILIKIIEAAETNNDAISNYLTGVIEDPFSVDSIPVVGLSKAYHEELNN